MRLTGQNLWGEYPDHDGGIALLRQAVGAGVNHIDTADVYGPHTNELLIREALHPYAEDLLISTKGGFVRGGPLGDRPGLIEAVGNANYLRQCVHLSARRLGVERIDLYYLHSGWAKDASFEDQVGTLAELRQAGLIRHIGLSNVSVEQLRVARQIVEITAVMAHFNVVARQAAPLLDATVDGGAVFVPWQPHCHSARSVHLTDLTRVAARTIARHHADTRYDERRAPAGQPRCAAHRTESR
jgi:aryl-alcohol dehydrogenase-like predicted oxidoreductase